VEARCPSETVDFQWTAGVIYQKIELTWRFGGTCRLHLQNRRISQARSGTKQVPCCLFLASFLLILFFDPEEVRDIFSRNVCWFLSYYMALYHNIQISPNLNTKIQWRTLLEHLSQLLLLFQGIQTISLSEDVPQIMCRCFLFCDCSTNSSQCMRMRRPIRMLKVFYRQALRLQS
jgi:hypothetical protein